MKIYDGRYIYSLLLHIMEIEAMRKKYEGGKKQKGDVPLSATLFFNFYSSFGLHHHLVFTMTRSQLLKREEQQPVPLILGRW